MLPVKNMSVLVQESNDQLSFLPSNDEQKFRIIYELSFSTFELFTKLSSLDVIR